MTPNPAHERDLQRAYDAETFQGYFPDHAVDERHPQPGIDATHRHFGAYLQAHPTQPGETT